MTQDTFSRSELRLEENPFHSVLSQPWGMVALGGLLVRLHLIECPYCQGSSLLRTYWADKVALLWPIEDTPEGIERRHTLSQAPSHEVAMMAMDSPALVYAGPHELKSLRTGLPAFVRDFFFRTKSVLAYPLATHKGSVNAAGFKILGDFCPHCQAEITGSGGEVLTTLMVANHADEPALYPVALICQL